MTKIARTYPIHLHWRELGRIPISSMIADHRMIGVMVT